VCLSTKETDHGKSCFRNHRNRSIGDAGDCGRLDGWTVGDLQDIVAVGNLILRNRKSTFVNAPEEVIQAAQSAAKSCNLSARLHWWHVVDLASLRIIAAHNIRQRK